MKRISDAVNTRVIGFYLDEELLSGKAFIPGVNTVGSPDQFRQVFRKVIDFGPLPNTGTKSVPHGILFDNQFTLVSLTAAATNPTTLTAFSPVYAPSPDASGVQLFMNATNVVIITNSNRSGYTRCFVVIEYMQEL
jgi:hypothetical protein